MTDCGCEPTPVETKAQQRVLWIALSLNATMFVVEVTAGLAANSSGLLADGLDMLTDAASYAIALFAVGRSVRVKANVAMLTGAWLLLLGFGVLADVGRRFMGAEPPQGTWMMGVAAIALAVNVSVLRLLSKERGEVHMRATWICTRADVVANAAVIVSGLAVVLTRVRYFDLIVGAAIGLYVIKEALEIFSLARREKTKAQS